MAELDASLSAVAQDRSKLDEKLSVLSFNAEKINPDKKVAPTQTIVRLASQQLFDLKALCNVYTGQFMLD